MDLTFPEYQFEEVVVRSENEYVPVGASEHDHCPQESLPPQSLEGATLSAAA